MVNNAVSCKKHKPEEVMKHPEPAMVMHELEEVITHPEPTMAPEEVITHPEPTMVKYEPEEGMKQPEPAMVKYEPEEVIKQPEPAMYEIEEGITPPGPTMVLKPFGYIKTEEGLKEFVAPEELRVPEEEVEFIPPEELRIPKEKPKVRKPEYETVVKDGKRFAKLTLKQAVDMGLIPEIRQGEEPEREVIFPESLVKKPEKPKPPLDRKADIHSSKTKKQAAKFANIVDQGIFDLWLIDKNDLSILVGKYDTLRELMKSNGERLELIESLYQTYKERLDKVEGKLLGFIGELIELKIKTARKEKDIDDAHATKETLMAKVTAINEFGYRIGKIDAMSDGKYEGFEEEVKKARETKKNAEKFVKDVVRSERENIEKEIQFSGVTLDSKDLTEISPGWMCGYTAALRPKGKVVKK